MRSRRFVVVALIVSLLFPLPASPAEKTFVQKIVNGALDSAGSKGAEFALKFVGGWIYNLSCKGGEPMNESSQAFCSALGGVSGASDDAWKQKIEDDLRKISGQLDSLASGQRQIQNAIATLNKEMEDQFKQVPNTVKVTSILTTIDNFWGRFQAAMDPKSKVTEVDLENFARDVMSKQLHLKLGELNSLLAHPIDNAQPLLQYPFYQFRRKHSRQSPAEGMTFLGTYSFAERKWAYYRGEQHKGYLIYLWAAEIIQSKCELKGDTRCAALPMTSTDFHAQYERYTRAQLTAFNTAAAGMVLAYSNPYSAQPRFLPIVSDTEDVLARVSQLTSTVLGDGEGAWGLVVSVPQNPWEARVNVRCYGTPSMLLPVLSYQVPVDLSDDWKETRPPQFVDWWTSRQRDRTYDEVHFSQNWVIHHYRVGGKKVLGPCYMEPLLPRNPHTKEKQVHLPWASDGQVVNVTRDGATYPVGFFYGIQRAGGTFAMASGQDWEVADSPEKSESGVAQKKETRFDSVISKNHHQGLWAGVLNMARVDHNFFTVTGDANHEARVMNRIYAYNRKSIWFPEGGKVTLRLEQHLSCESLCRSSGGVERGILDYDVEHSPYENGKLTAVVAVFLDPKKGLDDIGNRAHNGIHLDGSYGDTTERKTHRIADSASGKADVSPGQAYHLQYLIHFDLLTHSKRVDPTRYRFLGKVTPYALYVTR